MPNLDGTGPQRAGPMTGRGFGPCCVGRQRGFRGGFGYRRQVTLTKDQEKKILNAELEEIELEKQEIELEKQEIEKRLKELE